MTRVYNFSAGPAVLPEEVLKKAAGEMLDYRDSGMSVMEMSHRSKIYEEIINETESILRSLMDIPETYTVLFLQGGASSQFDMVPLNLFRKSGKADFVHTGNWSKRAIDDAKRYGKVNVIATSEDKNFSYIPELNKPQFDKDADYFYICSNNTIEGTKFPETPDTGNVPLVSDMSSYILSEPFDIKKYGIVFAGAQKNIGPAGLTIVIIRTDLIGHASDQTPTMFNYKTHSDSKSMFNTPPTYSIYMAKLVFEWLKGKGGIAGMKNINEEKAAVLYDFLDESKMFRAVVDKKYRSLMNVPFVTGNKDLDSKFTKEAEKEGLVTLGGHRSVGGMRASIYNAMPVEGVKKLVDFMKKFEASNK
jgi:phosphoserine aminotransferase